jgi:PIN domain nuclease of toxin-antitoxin system
MQACSDSGIVLLDITVQHAATAAGLPAIHGDPFDRMIIAQAIVEELTAVTDGPLLRRYNRLQVFER